VWEKTKLEGPNHPLGKNCRWLVGGGGRTESAFGVVKSDGVRKDQEVAEGGDAGGKGMSKGGRSYWGVYRRFRGHCRG